MKFQQIANIFPKDDEQIHMSGCEVFDLKWE